jgi:phage gpG-like protein
MLSITVIGDKELIARFSAMPSKLHAALLRKVYELALKLEAHVKNDKLSGQVLNHKSGNLWRSIQNHVTDGSTSVTGKVYSAGDVKYAAIHEFGGHIPSHVIEAKNAKSLAFVMGGQMRFFKQVNWPGATMPERSFLRSSLSDMKDDIVTGLKEAAQEAVKE